MRCTFQCLSRPSNLQLAVYRVVFTRVWEYRGESSIIWDMIHWPSNRQKSRQGSWIKNDNSIVKGSGSIKEIWIPAVSPWWSSGYDFRLSAEHNCKRGRPGFDSQSGSSLFFGSRYVRCIYSSYGRDVLFSFCSSPIKISCCYKNGSLTRIATHNVKIKSSWPLPTTNLYICNRTSNTD